MMLDFHLYIFITIWSILRAFQEQRHDKKLSWHHQNILTSPTTILIVKGYFEILTLHALSNWKWLFYWLDLNGLIYNQILEWIQNLIQLNI